MGRMENTTRLQPQILLMYIHAIAGELKDRCRCEHFHDWRISRMLMSLGSRSPGLRYTIMIPNSTSSTRIVWQDGVTNVTNQSADWNLDNKLDFTIGTIKVGETWEATFRLKVKQSGSIDVFGANSSRFL